MKRLSAFSFVTALICFLGKATSGGIIWDTDTAPHAAIFDIYSALNVDPGNPNLPRINVQVLTGGSGTYSIITAKMVVGGLLYKFPTLTQVTIDDLAKQFGYDHFNWLNKDFQNPQRVLVNGFPDPLPGTLSPSPGGGFSVVAADNYPYYWDEGQPANNPYGIAFHTKDIPVYAGGRFVDFWDEPYYTARSDPNTYDHFITSLVGVYGPSHPGPVQYDILYSFSWDTNYDGKTGGISNVDNRNIAPTSGGTGGISNLTLGVDINSLSNDIKQSYIDSGAGNVTLTPLVSAPEPSTLSLCFLGGSIFVAKALRRRQKQRITNRVVKRK